MRIVAVAGTRTRTHSGEPPRSTAYYYADLERLKRKNGLPPDTEEPRQNPDELSEYVESNEVVNDGAVKEVPPLRDRQWSLPEYSTPENARKVEETYSTAGTFPMPEPKEKEPLLAELEVVGRLPLTQLETTPGVRRSRSWYLCCPNVADEEISRESSWRYSSLRPVTAPPLPGQNGIHLVASQSSGRVDDAATLRAERDALARALAAERQRAASAARAHDARLAELHGVIAELVRRRAADKQTRAIPEEEVSDECESTTQPAGELEPDAELSRTEQQTSSLSPDLPTPQDPKLVHELPDDTTETSTQEIHVRVERPAGQGGQAGQAPQEERCDTSFNISERDSEICVSTARCCQYARGHAAASATSAVSGASCERERGSGMLPASPGRCESRQAKVASRVRLRLRRTDESDSNHLVDDEAWCAQAAERLALDVCAQADLREALVAAGNDGAAALWRARCVRLAADCRVLDCALARAVDTAHRLSSACALQESSSVALCSALRAADRALETYDVLLALAETSAHAPTAPERLAAEGVALRLARRLARAPAWGEPLLSPGPWHDHHTSPPGEEGEGEGDVWNPTLEARLRRHAARLKRETVELRRARPPPRLYSPHDTEDAEDDSCSADSQAADMEAAVLMQEVLAAREARIAERLAAGDHKTESIRRERHWLRAQPETDL